MALYNTYLGMHTHMYMYTYIMYIVYGHFSETLTKTLTKFKRLYNQNSSKFLKWKKTLYWIIWIRFQDNWLNAFGIRAIKQWAWKL